LLSDFKNICVTKINNLPTKIERIVIGTDKISSHINNTLQEVNIDDFGYATSIRPFTFVRHTNLKNITIPDSVSSIGERAFEGCTSLESVIIPNSVKIINSQTFDGCTNLKNVVISNGVTSINSYAFYGCSNLENITIGSGVTSIGESAFDGCTSLENVYATDVASWVGINFYSNNNNDYETDTYYRTSNPMYYAENLYFGNELAKDVVIPDGVTSINSDAFSGCECLESIIIPDSVTSSIGYNMFRGCINLRNITIGSGVRQILGGVFYNHLNLTDIYLKSTTPPYLDSIYAIPKTTTIHVPIGSGEAYRSATDWSFYASRIVEDIEI
jgi:hypothetical protein